MKRAKEIYNRRRLKEEAETLPLWILINFLTFLIIWIEIKYGFIPSLLTSLRQVILIFEIALMLLFFINTIYNSYLFIKFKKFTPPLELTLEEFTLFGIDKNEIGFKLKENNHDDGNGSKLLSLKNRKSKTPPPFDISLNDSSFLYDHHSSLDSTALSTKLFNDTTNLLNDTKPTLGFFGYHQDKSLIENKNLDQSLSPSSLRFRKSKSFLNQYSFHNNDSNGSQNNNNNNNSNGGNNHSTSSLQRFLKEREERDEEIQELIQAQRRYGIGSSPSNQSQIMDSPPSPYNQYHHHQSITKFDLSSISTPRQSPQQQFNNSAKLNLFNSSFNRQTPPPTQLISDFNSSSPMINTSQSPSTMFSSPIYKPAIKINKHPQLSSSNLLNNSSNGHSIEKSESLNSSHRILEKILIKLNVDDSRLNQMVENIRKWISQTILCRLSKEIESINNKIIEKGYIDSLIGETSIKQLKSLAENKRSEFPTLEQVCPFLDISNCRNIENNIPFQQYLVRRIKDLAKGGCMIEFLWDGGGNYNYKPWKVDSMLTDSEIVLHMFCVYMDSRLLFNPTIPEGRRPFTSQYFRPLSSLSSSSSNVGGSNDDLHHQTKSQSSSPSRSSSTTTAVSTTATTSSSSDTYIKQDKAYPPHYSLVLKSESFEIPPGRNNLFHTLLVFIHHIKVKNFGLLGRINLGPSGLNIAWVIEK